MGNTLDEEMLVQHMDLRKTTKLLNGQGSHLAILIEHMDGTDYEVSVNDRKETPEHLTTLLATVMRGADMMVPPSTFFVPSDTWIGDLSHYWAGR